MAGGYGVALRSVAASLGTTGGGSLPVTDMDGHYLGTLAAQDLMHALASDEDTTVEALTLSIAPLGSAAPIGDALKQLATGTDAVPVQDDDGSLIGWVRHRDILTALSGAQT